jgi:hypothetical protein
VWDIALAVLFPGGFLRLVTPTGLEPVFSP